jgi:hypothetical protein
MLNNNTYSYDYYNMKTKLVEKKNNLRDGSGDCDLMTGLVIANGGNYLTMVNPRTTYIYELPEQQNALNVTPKDSNIGIELNSEKIATAKMSIVSLSGATVYEQELGILAIGVNSFNISLDLMNGTYFCKVTIGERVLNQKFQVKR